MGMYFDESKPIYQQLMTRLSSEIVRGERIAGKRLPSVREYALEAGVNVNTIQRVYRELESLDIVETKRGQGTFVTEDQVRLASLRENMKVNVVQEFIRNMQEMGYDMDGIINSIAEEGEGNR